MINGKVKMRRRLDFFFFFFFFCSEDWFRLYNTTFTSKITDMPTTKISTNKEVIRYCCSMACAFGGWYLSNPNH